MVAKELNFWFPCLITADPRNINVGFPFKAGHIKGLTVRPQLVEGWAGAVLIVRQGSLERSRRVYQEGFHVLQLRFLKERSF